MIYKLSETGYAKVRALFEPLRFHLASAAVLDGNNPGRVFVDDTVSPRVAFMASPEGCYLAGNPDNARFNRALNKALFDGTIFGRDVGAAYFVCDLEQWRESLPIVFSPREPILMRRLHLICRTLKHDWRNHLLDGYAVQRVTGDLLSRPGFHVPEHLRGWITNNWGTTAAFLEKGFGFATIHGDEAVSWSLADCFSGDACEIGIHTVEAHRRRGLAAVTAAAAVDYALSNGFARVGWHTSQDNLGSIRTAERVGFEKERDYSMPYFIFDEADHQSARAFYIGLPPA
jgi:RimJ/RimL family protein N-acetyltransferase